MLRFPVSISFFVVTFTATIKDAAAVSPDILTPSELSGLDNLLKDFNSTALSRAIEAYHPHARLNVVSTRYTINLFSILGNNKFVDFDRKNT